MTGHSMNAYDPVLLFVALAICVTGGWATSRFIPRLLTVDGFPRYGWIALTATVAGASIWCTHFVAMLAYQGGALVELDQTLTVLSLVIAVIGIALALTVAAAGASPARTLLGGVLLGGAIVGLHYTGMAAYHVDGTVTWSAPLVLLSALCSLGLSTAALFSARRRSRAGRNLLWGLLVLAVWLLHFIGMAAFRVSSHHGGAAPVPDSLRMLAVFVTLLAFVVMASGIAGYLIDHARAESEQRLRTLALFDALTGLPNRAHFSEHLDREITGAGERRERFALVGIDVNNFKDINDLRGHDAGDEVLRTLGSRLAELTDRYEHCFIARVGGDEFAAIVRVGPDSPVEPFLDELDRTLTAAVPLRDGADEVRPRAAGMSVYPDDGVTAEEIVANADLAMYRSKANPGHGACRYDHVRDGRTRARRLLGSELRNALARGEFQLHYQLQSDVQTGTHLGFEALLRWEHPAQGQVSPEEFIPLAEENGLIVPIGAWVLREACAAAASWEPRYRVAVNVSAVQLTQQQRPDLAELVRDVLESTGLAPERLEIELTETAVFSDRERALQTLGEIKDLGVRVALDDFGAGHSSLDVLRSFPFDRLKIDRSIFAVASDAEQLMAREIMQTISSLGHALGMTVLAEGIETREQFIMLRDAGVAEAQGYFLGRPSPLQEIVEAGTLSVAAGAVRPSTVPPRRAPDRSTA